MDGVQLDGGQLVWVFVCRARSRMGTWHMACSCRFVLALPAVNDVDERRSKLVHASVTADDQRGEWMGVNLEDSMKPHVTCDMW